tara:strand:+ start:29 stop:751 length:723 start_codon:yes stop_codon:yes gene_type:complete
MSRSNDIANITASVLDGVTKAEVGLGNVDNTADFAKPVSTAQQSAIDLKANIASPTFTGTTNVSSGVTLPSNPTIDLGSNTTFPAGHVINWANGTNTRTGELTISTSGTDHTDLSCNLTTTSTSNKMVVQCFIPGCFNKGITYRALHVGFRYSSGGGADVLGSRSFVAGFFNYMNSAEQLIVTCHAMVTCAVPAVGTLTIFPRLQANNGDFDVYANASGTSGGGSYIYDEASIIAYEVKQ